jgi:hypothetical protein
VHKPYSSDNKITVRPLSAVVTAAHRRRIS